MMIDKLIKLSKSCLTGEEKASVMSVLDSEFLGMGAKVLEFEQLLSNYFQREAICVVNGTAALHLALQACEVGIGDEVLVPSLTYLATYQAISATGAIPISCDIDIDTLHFSLEDAKKRVSSKTKAIIPVHYSGSISNMDEINLFAKNNNYRVIEDAAHAFGSKYKKNIIGSFGDIACFSFDGIKNITSGEGGCIVTNDKKVISRIKDARLLGVENDSANRYIGKRTWDFDVKFQGWRYHMSDIMAAIGIEQFKTFEAKLIKRQLLAKHYDKILKPIKKLSILNQDYNLIVPHIYPIRILNLTNREELRSNLLKLNIQTGIHYKPNHKHTIYKNKSELVLSNTEQVYSELLSLPLHPDLSLYDVEYVCESLLNLL